MMGTILHDLRFGLRMLLKSPVIALTAVLSLSLSIGVNTTIFSFVNAMLLRPLPFADPSRVMSVFSVDARHQIGPHESSYPDYLYYRDQNNVFSHLSAHIHYPMGLNNDGETQQVLGEIVSGDYFDMLGIRPVIGRTFSPGEDQATLSVPVAVISHDFWQRRFNGDPGVIGKTIVLTGHTYNVIGVTPRDFNGTITGLATEVWVPIMMLRQFNTRGDLLADKKSHWLYMTGRLKPGVSAEQCQAEMNRLAKQLEQMDADGHEKFGAVIVAKDASRFIPALQRVATIFFALLMAVVAMVLLIACANVAGMLLARSYARRQEIAIRLSLGASRGRLIRQLLIESMVLAIISGGIGLLLAYWSTSAIEKLQLPLPVPIAIDLSPDLRVLSFTLIVSILTSLVFGLIPALQSTRQDLTAILKDGAATIGRRGGKLRLRGLLLAAQVTVSLALLIGSGLFIRILIKAQTIDPGMNTENVIGAAMNVELNAYDEARGREFYRQLTQRLSTLPSVKSVTVSNFLPLGASHQQIDIHTGSNVGMGGLRSVGVDFNVVGENYFATLGIPILRGREFSDEDRAGARNVIIINETMARRFWPGEDPLGKQFLFGGIRGRQVEVIGIVKDGKYRSWGEDPRPFMYVSYLQDYRSRMTVLVRTINDSKEIVANLRREVRQLAPNMPVLSIRPLREDINISFLPAQFGALVLGLFGVLAVILVAISLYGGISYYVNQQQREIGIRLALGAKPRDIMRHVVGGTMVFLSLGMIFGLLLAYAFGRIITGVLYGVAGVDLLTYFGVVLFLLLVSAAACFIPVRHAIRLDPARTLKYE